MQLLIFVLPQLQLRFWAHFKPFRSLSGGGLKWTFCYLVASQPSGIRHFRTLVPYGTLVGSNGLGPSTSRLSGVCSNQLSYEPICGGGNRVRTDDPLLAGQVLYQLSYTPNFSCALRKINAPLVQEKHVY